MDPISLALSVGGLIVTGAIALWQHQRAKRAETEVQNLLRSIPDQVISNVAKLLPRNETMLELYDALDSPRALHSRFADLDADGEEELMVQAIAGAHATALQVYRREGGGLELVAELFTDTPAGFVAKDADGDGRLEVVTEEVSRAADAPYVLGFRDEVWYRLEGNQFVEVKRMETYPVERLDELKRERRNEIA